MSSALPTGTSFIDNIFNFVGKMSIDDIQPQTMVLYMHPSRVAKLMCDVRIMQLRTFIPVSDEYPSQPRIELFIGGTTVKIYEALPL